ncbi:MAG: hypothetical protein ACI96M_002998 [Candidatus Azotimanducaceae bacterium]|jgi:hypothetical protein
MRVGLDAHQPGSIGRERPILLSDDRTWAKAGLESASLVFRFSPIADAQQFAKLLPVHPQLKGIRLQTANICYRDANGKVLMNFGL